jgi:hypothetical protein
MDTALEVRGVSKVTRWQVFGAMATGPAGAGVVAIVTIA